MVVLTMLLIAFAPVGNAAIPFLITAQPLFGYTAVVYNIAQVITARRSTRRGSRAV